MRQAGRVCAGMGLLFTLCGFAPPVMMSPWLLSTIPVPSLTAPEFPVAEPLAASLTPDTRRGLEHLLASA